MKLIILAPLVLILGACKLGLPERKFVSREPTNSIVSAPVKLVPTSPAAVAPADAARTRAVRIAVLWLPQAAGAVVKLRERHYINGTRQEIILKGNKLTPGENVIDVSIRTSSSQSGKILEIGPPSRDGIRNEILSRFPKTRMSIVTQPRRNRFGPFGLAIGRRANGARCVFAWQWIDDLRSHVPNMSNFGKFGALIGRRALATSIRIKLCRGGTTVDQLASYLEALRLNGRRELDRVVRWDRRNLGSQTIGADGTPQSGIVAPVNTSLEAALGGPTTVRAAKPKRRAVRRSSKKRTRVRTRRAVSRKSNGRTVDGFVRPPVVPGGRKYLAPVANAPVVNSARPQVRAPVYNGGASVPNGAGLPAEAYRGPQN